jgi:DNA replication and repair protein RecF
VTRKNAAQNSASRPDAKPRTRIHRLQLVNFRSYRRADMSVDGGPVLLLGPNGAGKTNLLEGISFLSPGRGLRRATLEDVASTDGDGSWAVSAHVAGALGEVQLGTGIDPPGANGAPSRRCRIDRESVPSATAFADHLRVIWLVPEMDGLFIGPASERRRFLDRLVLAIDATHASRVNALERALRSRNRLLEDVSPDPRWLDAIEHEIAELGIAVAAARAETVRRLMTEIASSHDPASHFPSASLSLEGWLERDLEEKPAIEIEDGYRASLREARPRDRAAGRTLEGPHLSDLAVVHAEKHIPASRASTGERKALLVGVVLSHARLVTAMHGAAPIVLLDDVAAFLDEERREALFGSLSDLGAQVWMTGVDESAFAILRGVGERFRVSPGHVESMA